MPLEIKVRTIVATILEPILVRPCLSRVCLLHAHNTRSLLDVPADPKMVASHPAHRARALSLLHRSGQNMNFLYAFKGMRFTHACTTQPRRSRLMYATYSHDAAAIGSSAWFASVRSKPSHRPPAALKLLSKLLPTIWPTTGPGQSTFPTNTAGSRCGFLSCGVDTST
jgi:hypothetical protein